MIFNKGVHNMPVSDVALTPEDIRFIVSPGANWLETNRRIYQTAVKHGAPKFLPPGKRYSLTLDFRISIVPIMIQGDSSFTAEQVQSIVQEMPVEDIQAHYREAKEHTGPYDIPAEQRDAFKDLDR